MLWLRKHVDVRVVDVAYNRAKPRTGDLARKFCVSSVKFYLTYLYAGRIHKTMNGVKRHKP